MILVSQNLPIGFFVWQIYLYLPYYHHITIKIHQNVGEYTKTWIFFLAIFHSRNTKNDQSSDRKKLKPQAFRPQRFSAHHRAESSPRRWGFLLGLVNLPPPLTYPPPRNKALVRVYLLNPYSISGRGML